MILETLLQIVRGDLVYGFNDIGILIADRNGGGGGGGGGGYVLLRNKMFLFGANFPDLSITSYNFGVQTRSDVSDVNSLWNGGHNHEKSGEVFLMLF